VDYQSPTYVKNLLKSLTERAAAGKAGAAENLALLLADHPELSAAVRQVDDLTTRAEEAWVKAAAAGDALAERAVREEVAALKAELLGPGAGVVDRVLAGMLAVAHVSHAHAATSAAKATDDPGLAALRDRRLGSAQRRLMAAARWWKQAGGKGGPEAVFRPSGRAARA
jgi:hypothetical protein